MVSKQYILQPTVGSNDLPLTNSQTSAQADDLRNLPPLRIGTNDLLASIPSLVMILWHSWNHPKWLELPVVAQEGDGHQGLVLAW